MLWKTVIAVAENMLRSKLSYQIDREWEKSRSDRRKVRVKPCTEEGLCKAGGAARNGCRQGR